MIVTYKGFSLGTGTPYPVTGLTGIRDMPGVRTDDYEYPNRDGDLTSPDLLEHRTIVMSLGILGNSMAELYSLRDALQAAIVIGDSVSPLVIGTKLFYAKPRKRDIPDDLSAPWRLGEAAIEWYCADPLEYSTDETVVSVGLPVSSGGLTIPIVVPVVLGVATTGGEIVVYNNGNAPAPVKLTFIGELVNPQVRHAEQGRVLHMTYTTLPGETLELDSARHSVTLTAGPSRRAFLDQAQWFSLNPGPNTLQFSADSSTGTPSMEIRFRHTTL